MPRAFKCFRGVFSVNFVRFCCCLTESKPLLQVLRFLESHGWTFNDLSFRILEGKCELKDECLQVNNSKAVLVFAETGMFEDKLPPQLPLIQMWIAAIRAHGIDAEKRFGGDGIIILSTGEIARYQITSSA